VYTFRLICSVLLSVSLVDTFRLIFFGGFPIQS